MRLPAPVALLPVLSLLFDLSAALAECYECHFARPGGEEVCRDANSTCGFGIYGCYKSLWYRLSEHGGGGGGWADSRRSDWNSPSPRRHRHGGRRAPVVMESRVDMGVDVAMAPALCSGDNCEYGGHSESYLRRPSPFGPMELLTTNAGCLILPQAEAARAGLCMEQRLPHSRMLVRVCYCDGDLCNAGGNAAALIGGLARLRSVALAAALLLPLLR